MALFDETAKYTRSFTDAHAFLEALRTSSTDWGTGWQCDWIFRGQRDAEWGLIPSAHRVQTMRKLDFLRTRIENQFQHLFIRIFNGGQSLTEWLKTELLQSATETELVLQFEQGAKDAGLTTPKSSPDLNVRRVLSGGFGGPLEFANEFQVNVELFALAQHHGIPTRLLDWTETAWNAAFFAANDCFTYFTSNPKPMPIGQIAVWAARRSSLKELEIPIEESNRAGNAYLRAQRGIFTWDPNAGKDFVDRGYRRGIEQKLMKVFDDNQDAVRKFTLGVAQVPTLLRLLFRERIAQHAMMPSYNAAAAGALIYDSISAAEEAECWFTDPRFRTTD